MSITARCPIQCAHCIIDAGPHRKEEMRVEKAVEWIRQSAQYESGKIKTVIITGGEPFCSPVLLRTILETSASLGLVSVVVTNAFWGHSIETAEKTLGQYPQIDVLSISTDKYHRRFIPIARVRNAMNAAKKMNIPFNAAVCIENEKDLLESCAGLSGVVDLSQIRAASVLPAGRGRFLHGETFAFTEKSAVGGPCSGADFPIIFPDGRVLSCMGITEIPSAKHPLLSGNVHDRPLAEILRIGAHDNYLQAMRSLGRDFVVKLIAATPAGSINLEYYKKYGSCSLCYAMANDPEILELVLDRISHGDVTEKVAAARMSRFGEKNEAVPEKRPLRKGGKKHERRNDGNTLSGKHRNFSDL